MKCSDPERLPMFRSHFTGKNIIEFALISILVGLFTIMTGCSTRRWMVREMTDVMQAGATAQLQDDDLELVEAALPANIKLLETLLASSPGNRSLLILLSRQYASYAFGFLEFDLERAELTGPAAVRDADIQYLRNRISRYYRKGMDYALQALELRYPDSRSQLASLSSASEFNKSVKPKDVAGLFWYGFNLSGYVNLNRDSIRAVSRAHLVEKTMLRVLELDPTYFYDSAHLILLAYYASRSPMMGGNLDAALVHYHALDQAREHKFLLNNLLYARYYLYQKQDRKAFISVLTEIENKADKITAYRLFNAIASKRAKLYLDAVDQLIEPDTQ